MGALAVRETGNKLYLEFCFPSIYLVPLFIYFFRWMNFRKKHVLALFFYSCCATCHGSRLHCRKVWFIYELMCSFWNTIEVQKTFFLVIAISFLDLFWMVEKVIEKIGYVSGRKLISVTSCLNIAAAGTSNRPRTFRKVFCSSLPLTYMQSRT